jgi:hypothetical protein
MEGRPNDVTQRLAEGAKEIVEIYNFGVRGHFSTSRRRSDTYSPVATPRRVDVLQIASRGQIESEVERQYF